MFVKIVGMRPNYDGNECLLLPCNKRLRCYSAKVSTEQEHRQFLEHFPSVTQPFAMREWPLCLVVLEVDGEYFVGESGCVYVMNKDGKTIDRP